jgi:hypothetical protein
MPDYQTMYYVLCQGIEAAMERLEENSEPWRILYKAQNEAEDIYVDTAAEEDE